MRRRPILTNTHPLWGRPCGSASNQRRAPRIDPLSRTSGHSRPRPHPAEPAFALAIRLERSHIRRAATARRSLHAPVFRPCWPAANSKERPATGLRDRKETLQAQRFPFRSPHRMELNIGPLDDPCPRGLHHGSPCVPVGNFHPHRPRPRGRRPRAPQVDHRHRAAPRRTPRCPTHREWHSGLSTSATSPLMRRRSICTSRPATWTCRRSCCRTPRRTPAKPTALHCARRSAPTRPVFHKIASGGGLVSACVGSGSG